MVTSAEKTTQADSGGWAVSLEWKGQLHVALSPGEVMEAASERGAEVDCSLQTVEKAAAEVRPWRQ